MKKQFYGGFDMKSSTHTASDHNHLIGWAIKNNEIVHISNVERGKNCGCICMECKEPLLARKGLERVHHFAHIKETNCKCSPETILHRLAKDIIAKSKYIKIPPDNSFPVPILNTRILIEQEKISSKDGLVNVDNVFVEREGIRKGFIPDIVLQSGDKFLIVEICVTNPVNVEKLEKIRQNNEHTIEIKLTADDALKTYKVLEHKLLEDIACKKWIYHPIEKVVNGILNENIQAVINHQMRTMIMPRRNLYRRRSRRL